MKAVASFPVLSAPLEPQMWHWSMGVWPPTWFLKALLDLSLLNPLLVQILDELVTLHPVDERTDVSTVPEEGAARQVDGTSCRGGGQRGRMWGVCCFNIWWERGDVKDKVRMLTEMLMDIWKVKHHHYSICYFSRGDYEIQTTHHPHMRYPLPTTPGSSAPIRIYAINTSGLKKNPILRWMMKNTFETLIISFTSASVDQADLIHTSQVGWCKFIK